MKVLPFSDQRNVFQSRTRSCASAARAVAVGHAQAKPDRCVAASTRSFGGPAPPSAVSRAPDRDRYRDHQQLRCRLHHVPAEANASCAGADADAAVSEDRRRGRIPRRPRPGSERVRRDFDAAQCPRLPRIHSPTQPIDQDSRQYQRYASDGGAGHGYVEFGVDVINIAIDGATPATFESIRKHLKLDTVEANVKRLIDTRNRSKATRPFIMVHMIHMPENAHETDLFLKKWTGVADQAGIAGIVSRVGSVAVPLPLGRPDPFPCFLLWNQLPVLSDGTVAMCCDDWNGAAGIGNLNTQSIRDVWRSGQRNALRSLHLQGRPNDIDLCRACSSPRRPPPWFVQAPTR